MSRAASELHTVRRGRPMGRAGRWRYVAHLAAWAYMAALVVPLYYLVISSVKSNIEIFNNPFTLAGPLQWSNYTVAFSQAQLGPAILSSAYVTVSAELATLCAALPAAYAIARSRGRAGRALEALFSVGFLIPGFAALVPSVMLAITLNMYRTREFLILLLGAAAIPLSVLLLAQAMRAIPRELEESATIDGASGARVFRSIYLPLTVPTVAVLAILNFLTFWNEYFFSLVVAGTRVETRTAQVALPTLSTTNNAQYGVLAAGVIITLVPVYAVYAVLARRMEGALLAGALKG